MNPLATASGLLTAAGPFALILGYWVHGPSLLSPGHAIGVAAAVAAVGLTAGGLSLARNPWQGRLLASLGVAGVLVETATVWFRKPAVALPILLSVAVVLSHLWVFPGLGRITNRYALVQILRAAPVRRARAAAVGALIVWALYVLGGATGAPAWPVLAGFGLSGAVTLRVLSAAGAEAAWRLRLLWLAFFAAAIVSVLGWSVPLLAVTVCALVPVASALLLPMNATAGLASADWWEPIFQQPARMLVTTFFALCVVGTLMLALPLASATDQSIRLSDAAFTAVSAVCVTGLAVLDTAGDFSPAGQVMVLLLIQTGGLGIMTFSIAALKLLGRRISLRQEAVMAELMTAQDKSRLFGSIRGLLLFTFVSEAVGAAILTVLFATHGDTPGAALWRGVFTAVSAFCNAGFSLQSDNLVPYQQDPLVLHTVALLIILGGLSPGAFFVLPERLLRRRRGPISAQARLIFVANAALILFGAIWYGAVEWYNTLEGLSLFDKLNNAYFQSVTLRTAGFNSVDITKVHSASLSMMMVWMFIGGSPGSTAGGVKVTTVGVLLLAVISTVRGRDVVLAFAKHIPQRTIFRAAAVTTVGGLGVLAGLLLLQLTQNLSNELAMFEVVSALGTVGLTMGATPELDGIGRAVIMLCMFMGRVGTLTLFMLLGSTWRPNEWRRPSEDLEVG